MDVNNTFPFRAQDFDSQKFIGSVETVKKAGNRPLGKDALPMWYEYFGVSHPTAAQSAAK